LLPTADCRPRYAELHADETVWQPALTVIAERHGLALADLRRATGGTHVVWMGDSVVVKLHVPWSADAEAEGRMLSHVESRLPLTTPSVVAEGELEGWPYLIMTRIRGRPLSELWSGVEPRARARLLARLGELAAALHALELPGSEGEARTQWVMAFDDRVQQVAAKHRKDGLDERWVAAIAAEVARLDLAELRDVSLACLHMDLQQDHLMVEEIGGRLEPTGLYDFGDAAIGAREHELIAPLAFMAPEVDDGARTFLQAYGYAPHQLDAALARRLTGHMLLQRYCSLPYLLRRLPAPRSADLGQLLARLWAFDG
jgi:hygromycin-B 7''-O-kinase